MKRTTRLGDVLCRRPSGEQRSILPGRSGMGGRLESRAQSYAAKPGSKDGTLQLSRLETLAKA